MKGGAVHIDYNCVPSVIYTHPEGIYCLSISLDFINYKTNFCYLFLFQLSRLGRQNRRTIEAGRC